MQKIILFFGKTVFWRFLSRKENGIHLLIGTTTLFKSGCDSTRKYTRRRCFFGSTPISEKRVIFLFLFHWSRSVMLRDIPDFEIYATHFKSVDYSTNVINVLYETIQSNYNQSLLSPFGSFFVKFVSLFIFLAVF